MYNVFPMKKVLVVSVFMIATFTWAAQSVALSLPTVAHADTEVTTNVVISSWQQGVAKFTFSLSCIATPSNNVEATFGEDVNTNGVLEPEEADLIVGWKRGSWFIQNGADGEWISVASTSMEDVKTLAWNYRLTAALTPARLSVMVDGTAAFFSNVKLKMENVKWV